MASLMPLRLKQRGKWEFLLVRYNSLSIAMNCLSQPGPAEIYSDAVRFCGASDLARQGLVPAGTYRNRDNPG